MSKTNVPTRRVSYQNFEVFNRRCFRHIDSSPFTMLFDLAQAFWLPWTTVTNGFDRLALLWLGNGSRSFGASYPDEYIRSLPFSFPVCRVRIMVVYRWWTFIFSLLGTTFLADRNFVLVSHLPIFLVHLCQGNQMTTWVSWGLCYSICYSLHALLDSHGLDFVPMVPLDYDYCRVQVVNAVGVKYKMIMCAQKRSVINFFRPRIVRRTVDPSPPILYELWWNDRTRKHLCAICPHIQRQLIYKL